jgi:hypothetical protein
MRSVCPLVCGWNAADIRGFIPRTAMNVCHVQDENREPLSETMSFDDP